MKLNKMGVSLLAASTFTFASANVFAEDEVTIQPEVSKNEVASFIGYDIGNYLNELFDADSANGVFDHEQRQPLLDALNAAFDGAESSYAEDDRMKYMEKMSQLVEDKAQIVATLNSQHWDNFVADVIAGDNSFNELVVGEGDEAQVMYYKVVTEGNGDVATVDDTVTVSYAGRVIKEDSNGDYLSGSNFDENDSAELGVSWVIPGWSAALKEMPVGSKWELYIPSDLGYGQWGAGADIPPGSPLFFDVELLDIVVKDDSMGDVEEFDFSQLG